jgi:predicted flap endonuclease-1-like 5' DNA nuclease
LNVWNDTGMAVYTDYVSKAIITPEEAERLKNNKRLLSYNPKDNLAMHLSYAGDYDCEKAVNQPANPLFIWNLITTLIPKKWHDEIKGFDENMPSWEDWEYWLRMARSGKCFVRITEPMIAYRFYTGGRRETGIQMPQELLSYITKKLEGVDIMPCRSCGGSKNVTRVQVVRTQVNNELVDNDMVLISYENPNRGMHKVVGASSHINYGPRQGGGVEKFYVHKSDIAAYPDWFVPFNPPSVVVENTPAELPPPPEILEESPSSTSSSSYAESPDYKIPDTPTASPSASSLSSTGIETYSANTEVIESKPLDKPFDLQSIPGVTERIAIELNSKGIKTWQDIIDFGLEGLKSIEGIGEKRAEAILNSARKNME